MKRDAGAVLISTIAAGGIIAFMLYRVWGDLVIALESARFSLLSIAVPVCVLAWVLRGGRYAFILRGCGIQGGLWLSTATIFVSQTANLIIPARLGDLVRMVILNHEKGAAYSSGFSSLVVERIFDIMSVALLGALAIPFVLNVPSWFYSLIALPLIGGAAFLLFVIISGRIGSENRYLTMILSILGEVKNASMNLRSFAVIGSYSLIIWLVDVAVCMTVAVIFGVWIPFSIVVLAIVIGNLVKAVPITPGGVGTYELSLAVTFELAGLAPATATLIAVIDHLIKNLVTLAGGVASIYIFGDWSVSLLKRAFSREIRRENLR
ncbi:MAG: lysylphosphatidylglycerol synthase transmembrane domain-containing protein [Methanomicrobiaceae archaeon]|nr:lysylphosphatidylglycerol synthase transmembrane domain-containing protein [Methanomicrobiaceae archaeon]